MSGGKRLRVLIIDDSAVNRRALADILASHSDIEVVGMADDGEKGLKAATTLRPDVICLDLEMPRMDGFTFLRVLMAQMPTPVIVVSSQVRRQQVFQVLELGALDFVAKPAQVFSSDNVAFREELIAKVLAVRSVQEAPLRRRAVAREVALHGVEPPKVRRVPGALPERLVVIGASTGGPPALQAIVKSLNEMSTSAMLIAQHMPERFTRAFAERLNRASTLEICEAEASTMIHSGGVFVAPGGLHLTVVARPNGWGCRIEPASPSDPYVPSIDQLFESVAQVFTGKILCVVLTGMGTDGSRGVRKIYQAGGQVLAESAESAIVYGMPQEAALTGCVHEVLPLEAIIGQIRNFVR